MEVTPTGDLLPQWPYFHATRDEALDCPACNPPREDPEPET